ncbi:MAG: hypothetical protein HIU83_03100 [Proteobacteria bacterium]|nr:hypothetical protein [Pseudomonadota bacterium]
MQKINKWIIGKPFLIALLAPKAAITARDIHEAFQYTKQRRILKHQFPLPYLPAWFAMYRSHKKPLIFLRKIFADFSSFGPESIEFGEKVLDGVGELARYNQAELQMSTPEEIEQIKPVMENMMTESLQEIKNDLSPLPADPSQREQLLSLFIDNSLESSFFILVTVPCWLIYRTLPTRLYRRARQGKVDALEKLLSLDPLMLHDPSIGKKLQGLRLNRKTTIYENLLTATHNDHQLNVTPQQMKYAIGGLISALAKVLKPLTKKTLSAAEIHKLFDAVAQDFDGTLTDPDLPINQDSFARAIFRYREEWLKVFQPDTKK